MMSLKKAVVLAAVLPFLAACGDESDMLKAINAQLSESGGSGYCASLFRPNSMAGVKWPIVVDVDEASKDPVLVGMISDGLLKDVGAGTLILNSFTEVPGRKLDITEKGQEQISWEGTVCGGSIKATKIIEYTKGDESRVTYQWEYAHLPKWAEAHIKRHSRPTTGQGSTILVKTNKGWSEK
ncbi:hypothetical protein [Telmatospirillum sp. J64-1]|uniref:hypothetical protein n=1 Tax=Telmatospirillum sp. J64-1 TaxID=2502183 RepID=UPI00115C4693|nr:hypothetical protein [Telmatospirillum sp. J64-1]